MNICASCGRELFAGARFCPACGQPVAPAGPSPTPPPGETSRSGNDGASGPEPQRSSGASATILLPPPGDTVRGDPVVAGSAPRGEEAAGAAAESGRTVRLLGLLSGLLAFALLAGGALAYVELGRRADRESALRGQVASLTQANLDFQSQVQSLIGERDRLAGERDGLAAERDRLLARVDKLEKTKTEQEKRIQELTGQVQEQGRQLSQAREEATRQQQRAETAESVGAVLAQIVFLDDEIHEEFGKLFDAMVDMQRAYDARDYYGFDAAYQRGLAAAQRLDTLFAQRDALMAQLGY
ncbi:MAG: hypothetical protein RMK01_08935 [Thermomicrobium sp.]|nr:hypothetical protein [Thermomicrobium sp.]MDW8060185.1 hypothetical protein [Thermomicrobium sp.]